MSFNNKNIIFFLQEYRHSQICWIYIRTSGESRLPTHPKFRRTRTSDEYEPQRSKYERRKSEYELQKSNLRQKRTSDEQNLRDPNPNVGNRNTNMRNRTPDEYELQMNKNLRDPNFENRNTNIRVLSSQNRFALQMSLHELMKSNPHLKCFRHTNQSGLFGRVTHPQSRLSNHFMTSY